MPEHTPGPWLASKDAVPKDYVQTMIYARTTGQRVATVFQSEGNVHLIAAAPELLEALRVLINLSGHPLFPDVSELPAWPKRIAEAQAAIAKAEGK